MVLVLLLNIEIIVVMLCLVRELSSCFGLWKLFSRLNGSRYSVCELIEVLCLVWLRMLLIIVFV